MKKEKILFTTSFDGGEIGIKCVYYTFSNKIHINNYTRSFYKHKKINIEHSKKNISTCSILKQHAYDLKNDPERLSTKFMQKLIGVKCE